MRVRFDDYGNTKDGARYYTGMEFGTARDVMVLEKTLAKRFCWSEGDPYYTPGWITTQTFTGVEEEDLYTPPGEPEEIACRYGEVW